MTLFDWFTNLVASLLNIPVMTITLILSLLGFSGCAELEKNQMAQTAKVVGEKVGDAVAKGIENGVRDVTAQATVQGINPGYKFRMKVTVGTVVDVDGDIAMTGVAGQMSINAASGRDTLNEAKPTGPLSGYPPGSRILETICIPPEPADANEYDKPVVAEPPQRVAANKTSPS